MIKHAEIYKQNIQGEIRYIAKMYVTYRDEMIDSFSSSYLGKSCWIFNKQRIRYNKLFWYDGNGGIMKIKKYFYNAKDIMKILEVSLSQAYKVIRELNEELKQKGIRVQRGKVAIEYFNERYKIA